MEIPPVARALQLCQVVWKDRANLGEDNELPIHKNQGHCGEPMAAHLYYASHTTPLAEQNARVATIVYKSRAPPCGTGKTVSETGYPLIRNSRAAVLTNWR